MDFESLLKASVRGFDVSTASKYPLWAWHVRAAGKEELPATLAKAAVTWLTLEKWTQPVLPKVIAKLPRLTRLEIRGANKLRRLPDFVFDLEHLEVLDLTGSAIENLDGIERAPALTSITLARTRLAGAKALRDLVAKVPHAELSGEPGTVFVVRPEQKLKNRKEWIAAIQRGSCPEIPKLDASGATFEGVDLYWAAPKPNFAKTTWRACRLHGDLRGANFDGAVFEDCVFSDRWFDGMSAKRATFRNCYFKQCVLKSAMLEGAELLAAPDSELDLSGARASSAQITATFTTPDAARKLVAPKADLRDATISLSLVQGAKRAKSMWPTDAFAGAKTSKRTRIEYGALDGSEATLRASTLARTEAPRASIVDLKGPHARVLGRIDAPNAGLWLLVADAKAAAAWRGDDGRKGNDFARAEKALETGKLAVTVADAKGMIVGDIGEHGYAYAYELDDGIGLLELGVPEQDVDESLGWKKLSALHGAHVMQLAAKRRTKLGKIDITSGALALLLPYTTLAKRGEDQLVVRLANGTYEVVKETFGEPPPADAYGAYVGRVMIKRA